MNKIYEPLFTPWKIGNVEIKNRIVLCPMGGTSLFGWMEPHHLDKDAADFFLERAKNNVGLIIPGIAPLKNLIGAGFGRSFALSELLALPIKNKVVGALMKPILDPSYISASPSELPSRWTEDVTCRALTKKEIEDIIYAYGQTAKMCKEAGVDGVEVHAVHEGYLLDQFTLKYTNKRTDEYGGSFENRYRFPVVCAGRMEPEVAAEAIAEGRIDAMGVARQFLTDGEWVTKLMEDRLEDIQPCICCHNGCFTMSKHKGTGNDAPISDAQHMARCALNPLTMQNGKYTVVPAKKKKNVAVIGGGVGGMEVARIATLRGHKVTIYEKSDRLGGVFIPAAAPSFKEKDRALIEWYRRQIAKLGIDVKFNTEVKDIASLGADEVVVATGAKPRKLSIPGIEKSIEAIDYLNGAAVGENVVIIGGGLTGCEIAYDLFLKGKHPVIVEAQNDIITTPGLCLANSSYLRDYFAWKKVPVLLESKVKKISEGSVTVEGADGKTKDIKADSVIVSVGYVPAPVAEKSAHVHIVGDAEKVGNLRTVVWKAWEVAEKL